jgi:hypothetical protein
MRNTHEILIARPERKKPPGRPRPRWEVKVKGKVIPVLN